MSPIGGDGSFIRELAGYMKEPIWLKRGEGDSGLFAAPNDWKIVEPPAPASPQAIELHTLTGVRDYIEAAVDGLEPGELMIHVQTPTAVRIVEALEGEKQRFRRKVYVAANAQAPEFKVNAFSPAEEFFIRIQTLTEDTLDRAKLLEFISSIRDSKVEEWGDDGISQEVKTARGITRIDRTKVPSPVILRPFRTFLEVEQPESPFVLRMKSGNDDIEDPRPRIGLFECDGGRWKNKAIESIGVWIREKIPTVKVVS